MSTVKKDEGKVMTNLHNLWKSIGTDRNLNGFGKHFVPCTRFICSLVGNDFTKNVDYRKVPRVLKILE